MNKEDLSQILEKEIPGVFKNIKTNFKVFLSSDLKFGDYSSNLGIILNKKFNLPREEIFKVLSDKVFSKNIFQNSFSKIELAPNGFLNFYLSKKVLFSDFKILYRKPKDFAKNDSGRNTKVNLEFVSANPTGPLTLGNSRGGVVGDVLARVLAKSSFRVTKEYYFNNKGNQIKVLGQSILSALGLVQEKNDFYKGEYIKELAKNYKKQALVLKNKPEELGFRVSEEILEKYIKKPLRELGIRFDVFYEEASLYEKLVPLVLNKLKENGFTYERGKALWLKSSHLGDNRDRVLLKSSGEASYLLPDIAYHYDKFKIRKFKKAILILGADHLGQETSLRAGLRALGVDDKKLIIIFQQFVNIKEGQELVRMSKRKGEYIALQDLIDEVGPDSVRFFFLMHPANQHIDFDVELAKKKSLENPVFYLQYVSARISSILKKAPKLKQAKDLKRIFEEIYQNQEVFDILRLSHRYQDVVFEISQSLEPSLLANFGISLAREFHNFYEKVKVLSGSEKQIQAKLALIITLKNLFQDIFETIGIKFVGKM